ncbi:MAG: ATP-binding protein [Bdellovibrionota bacterium]|nr:ATP-binding protein [Bdellovibrionota bacterium]
MIFLPGFSTKEEVTDVSGRGVGMDAVRTEVESLGGTISVTSKIDEGTTFTIELPVLS